MQRTEIKIMSQIHPAVFRDRPDIRQSAICNMLPSKLLGFLSSSFHPRAIPLDPDVLLYTNFNKTLSDTKYQPLQSTLATLNLLLTLTALSVDPDIPNEG
ncbi:hypothetical protein ASPFODRAFT_366584 [Aspergillus luchuensis CBS 106.47]|uniref:Uncharacterized protein n=1 Tax=Aspergillus luchuensis (strain CBS 106.47) TaxID=1137211 RepID=A0A1M3T533_ASPLC|nr:hypothetical protein ASPFODRAFT_366584 [Aspergillus luchuensis CBS 106.47]